MQKILRLSMRTQSFSETLLAPEDITLGGRALTSRIVHKEVPPTSHPFGRHNKLIFAGGALAGTLVSSSNRLSIGAKSPLTGGIKESNAGGNLAYKMGRLGIRALVIEDISPHGWWMVYIDAAGAKVIPAPTEIVGVGLYARGKILRELFGKHAGLALIGPAGEQRLMAAGIAMTDPEGIPARFSGRGGLGAVMASKGLLAVIVDDSAAPKETMADSDTFRAALKEIGNLVITTPQTAEIFKKYGTNAMLTTTNTLGALPVRNFSRGTFEQAAKLDADALYATIISRGGEGTPSHACMRGCLIQCSNIFPDATGKAIVSPLEYENIGMLGPNCGIGDLDTIANLNYACNDMGVDTIDTGAALAVAMEAGVAAFGDGDFALRTIQGIQEGAFLSKIIGSGAETTGKVLGQYRVPTAKGQAMAAYDPRSIKGTGVTYATSPMGGDHTAGNTPRMQVKHHEKEGQVANSNAAQHAAIFFDSLGLCIMLGAAVKDASLITNLINARFGTHITLEATKAFASATLELERDFNRRAGLGAEADRVAEFFYEESNPDSGAIFDFTPEELTTVAF